MRGKFTGNATAFPVCRLNCRWVVRRYQLELGSQLQRPGRTGRVGVEAIVR